MKGEFTIVRGKVTLHLENGTWDVLGHRTSERLRIAVPEGKAIIIQELSKGCKMRLDPEAGAAKAEKLPVSPYPPEWEVLINTILENNLRKILLLGEMDTGKTFLCTYMANRILRERASVAVVDCDLGQSDIGPPGCLGYSILEEPLRFMAEAPVSGLHFVGAHSAENNLTSIIVGLQHIVRAVQHKAEYIFIDTCGWTMGDGARVLKSAKVNVINPDLIVLLQRKDELEHLVAPFVGHNVFRLKVSKKSSPTDQMVRKALREQISMGYFAAAKTYHLPFARIRTMGAYFLTGTPIKKIDGIPLVYGEHYAGYEGVLLVPEKPFNDRQLQLLQQKYPTVRVISPGQEKGILVGLLDKRVCTLGLGIIQKIDFPRKKVIIISPIKEISRTAILSFGCIRYNQDGSEAGFVSPGTI